MNRTAVASCVAFVLSFGAVAQAAPITYSFSGSGSGVIGASAFDDAAFEVIIRADTTDVVEERSDAVGILNLMGGTITIDGAGTADFVVPLIIFGGHGRGLIRFGDDLVGNYIGIFDDTLGLEAYDMKSSFGPVTSENDNLDQFHDIATSLGILTFASMSPVTFMATVDAAVPEPAAWLLVGAGVAVAVVRLRRARR